MPEKPTLFISHSSRDGHIANVLKEQIEVRLPIAVFETSHFEAIQGGEKWLDIITANLDKAVALLVLVSFNSCASAWVHLPIYFTFRM